MSLDLRLAVTQNVYGESPVKVPCLNPNHQDDTASLAVYRDNLHCFGCGFHINDTAEALALLLGVTQAEARRIAPTYQGTAPCKESHKPLVPLPTSLATLYHNNLLTERSDRLDWLYARGLTSAGIALGRLGHTGASFVIPVFDRHHRLITLRFRRDDVFAGSGGDEADGASDGPKYRGLKGRNGVYLYGEEWLAHDSRDWCIITEGELDALRLWQDDIPAVSATNGAGQSHRVPILLRQLCPTYRTVMVATDTDAAGWKASQSVCKAAMQLGFRVVQLSWLERAKDVSEFLAQGGTLEGMIHREVSAFNSQRWEEGEYHAA